MKKIYENRSDGYSPKEKRAELLDRQSRFLLALGPTDDELKGFAMWRFDWEETCDDEVEEVEVVYCYELQVKESERGRGLGKELMKLLEAIGIGWGMKKVMLTVHLSNQPAVRFYTQKMKFEIDEISPSQFEDADPADYEILSKKLTIGQLGL
ncbi:hypothetical protein CROQUDRAFT_64024 [Cronartium quercuum f. sp. fusiforme G11]|uniref:N-alpha-acetyltransferase 40 n=1 Tax=Cronartium quercuum f. sp. fusiforme G11 TaxID=708437 RepID=A0A9P6NFV5_9BASI|nr:hypothetical protein CROQUDRAFT_64024 [Cronartium quercuum f. sp. fusiforme G11]